jgi:hypothetical protein
MLSYPFSERWFYMYHTSLLQTVKLSLAPGTHNTQSRTYYRDTVVKWLKMKIWTRVLSRATYTCKMPRYFAFAEWHQGNLTDGTPLPPFSTLLFLLGLLIFRWHVPANESIFFLDDTSQQTSKTRHVITPLRTVSGIAEQILPVELDIYLPVIALCYLLLPFPFV